MQSPLCSFYLLADNVTKVLEAKSGNKHTAKS